MTALIYTDLLSEKHIRIAELKAGEPTDPVQCCLKRKRLSNRIDFQALSYEWKQEYGYAEVYCNDIALKVTRNLVDALKSLRSPSNNRCLWIDAICINQSNNQEKSVQVRLMPEIYASAKSVVVWLGLSFQGVAEAFKMFPYLARVAIERHATGKPDTLTMDDYLRRYINEIPVHGSILQSKGSSYYIRHDRDSLSMNTIPQCEELSDEETFHFGDDEVWMAVDTLFNSSYFYRSWVIQEIGVAEGIYVLCGNHITDWDIFHVAYEGRECLRFKPAYNKSNLFCVRDARRRYRSRAIDNFHCFDLATVLTSFTYSRESDPRDRVYAALGIVFPRHICQDIVPDYSKSLSQVFHETARHMIFFRNDLYLWSSKTLMSTRTIPDLPTWVPEWTMPACEEALEFTSPEFAGCLPGNFLIEGNDLFVQGHVLDEICEVFYLGGLMGTICLVNGLRDWLQTQGSSLFSKYPIPCPDSTHAKSHKSRLQNAAAEANLLLASYNDLPRPVMELLHDIKAADEACGKVKMGIDNIESMWLVLTSTSYIRHTHAQHCGHLLTLSAIFWFSLYVSKHSPSSVIERIPDRYCKWFQLALLPLNSTELRIASDTLQQCTRLENTTGYIDDCFFVTKRGFFGRAPANSTKVGLSVAILGGAWTPYLLEHHRDHFKLISHTYVEGIMSMRRLGAGSCRQMLRLR